MDSLILTGVLALHLGMSHAPTNLATLHGKVTAVDAQANTVTVRVQDAWDDKFLISPKTTHVYGVGGALADGPQVLKPGTEVIVHYSIHGDSLDMAAVEIDQIGEGGMKKTTGSLVSVDRILKKLTVKGTDGAEQSFVLTDWAARDGGKPDGKADDGKSDGKVKGTADSGTVTGPVTVYFADEAGAKVAHYFGQLDQ